MPAKRKSSKKAKKGWGVHVLVPHGTLTNAQASNLEDSANKLMPHLVETIAKAHGIDASGSSAIVKRTPGP